MRRKLERGAAVVEFAFVLILLVPMFLVIIAWGIRFHNAAQADNAAFVAARYYAVKCATDGASADANAKAAGVSAASGLLTAANFTIAGGCTSGNTITVSISKDQGWSPALPIFGMTGNYTLGGNGAARCE